jgi:hypothetical protein
LINCFNFSVNPPSVSTPKEDIKNTVSLGLIKFEKKDISKIKFQY